MIRNRRIKAFKINKTWLRNENPRGDFAKIIERWESYAIKLLGKFQLCTFEKTY